MFIVWGDKCNGSGCGTEAEGDTHNSYVSVNCIRFEGMISARAGTPLYLSLRKVTHFLRTALRSGAKYFPVAG